VINTGARRVLLAVLAAPPTTSGTRTLSRISLAMNALGADDLIVANLFPTPVYRTTDISKVGAAASSWLDAREPLLNGLRLARVVLLAYGTSTPAGPARLHHRSQVSWLDEARAESGHETYLVGDGPRHPSRWHRWTRWEYPDVSFTEALALSLRRIP